MQFFLLIFFAESFAFQTVAVVKSSFNGDFANLQGKNYCHPGFEAGQTWTDRVLKVINDFKSAARLNTKIYFTIGCSIYYSVKFLSLRNINVENALRFTPDRKYNPLCFFFFVF